MIEKETRIPNLTTNKNLRQKKEGIVNNPSNISKQLIGNFASSDGREDNKTKLGNALHPPSSTNTRKLQHEGKTNTNLQGNKSVPRNTSSTLSKAFVPKRAKLLPTTTKPVRATNQNHAFSKKNTTILDKKAIHKKQNAVLNTPQNVTICSPPPKRKDSYCRSNSNDSHKADNTKLVRKESRTLDPDEIVLLKRESAKVSEENTPARNVELKCMLKEPVAFEVKFQDDVIKSRPLSAEKLDIASGIEGNDKENYYSDDFESYESDFETGSSTGSLTKSDTPSLQNRDISEILVEKNEHSQVSQVISNEDSSLSELTSDGSDHEDYSEGTQNPVTRIENKKEEKFDSGHYDMNSHKISGAKPSDMPVAFIQPTVDSLETLSVGISEQMDSGISTLATSTPHSYRNIREIIYGGYRAFYTKPLIDRRGTELMKKAQFDVLSFTLLSLKPISYDIFMRTFGKLNTNQNFTQTQHNQIDVGQQTEMQETRSVWTQHPAQFDIASARSLNKNVLQSQHCCGEVITERQTQFSAHCVLEKSLDDIKLLNKCIIGHGYQSYQKQQRRPINYENLNTFLLRSSFLIDRILGSSNNNTKTKEIQNPANGNNSALNRVSEKSFYMETNFLNSLRVLKVFSNNKYNLLITVHESLPETNVYSSDFLNLLMVWCTNNCDKPLRLLTTWSQVSKVEISNCSSDIIVAALQDGSIALWDLRETHSFCSKLDGYLTHFAATQTIIPSWREEPTNSKLVIDMGACLDVKSFRAPTGNIITRVPFLTTQFVSLHDSGLLSIWTLVENSERVFELPQTEKYEKSKCFPKFTHTFEYTSPWARIKMTQSAVVNIKEYLEMNPCNSQFRFEQTKDFFQKNVYSDEALKELGQYVSKVGQQGVRFSSLECGSENIFICTNQNFILMCSKSLKMDKLKRIIINESQFLFPTALKLLSNEHFLAVGLCNGAVMILNCQSNKVVPQAHKIIQKSKLLESVDTKIDSIKDNDSATGKSCAIQNILLNMKKSYEDIDFDREYRPSTAACITLIDSKMKPFELRILDQQVIMSGSVLRKNLIQSLELSSDGWYLFALENGHLRIYDFCLDQEIPHEESQETGNIIDIATSKCGCRENNLMILRPNIEVEVYILNK